MIQTKRACMRFYGDETISYYTAHEHKDMDSILEDDILTVLTPETTVMHDHNRGNYNERFSFQNIECNQRLERDLQKIADDNPSHIWAKKLKAHISSAIKNRKDLILKGVESFTEEYVKKLEYMDNYFRRIEDLSLPTTDNLSKRGLRGIKSHLKISGQFDSEKTAKYYSVVKTYIETCRKNKINEMEALSRLSAGNPYTVDEIFA